MNQWIHIGTLMIWIISITLWSISFAAISNIFHALVVKALFWDINAFRSQIKFTLVVTESNLKTNLITKKEKRKKMTANSTKMMVNITRMTVSNIKKSSEVMKNSMKWMKNNNNTNEHQRFRCILWCVFSLSNMASTSRLCRNGRIGTLRTHTAPKRPIWLVLVIKIINSFFLSTAGHNNHHIVIINLTTTLMVTEITSPMFLNVNYRIHLEDLLQTKT